MKKLLLTALAGILLSGCSGAFWGGAGTGVLGTGAGYEISARRQIDQLDKDLAEGKITQAEHDIRVDQVRRGSLIQ